MALNAQEKATVVADYQRGEGDTGSPEVQVALLTTNINKLQDRKLGQNDRNGRLILKDRFAGCFFCVAIIYGS